MTTTKPCDFFGGADPALNYFRKNLIINGGGAVDQRGNIGSTISLSGYPVDRFYTQVSNGTLQIGFNQNQLGISYFGFETTAAYSTSSASDYLLPFRYLVEGYDCPTLNKGGPVTISFWVFATKTGIYSLTFIAVNDTVRNSIVKEFTVSSSNQWQKIEITVDVPFGYSQPQKLEDGIGLQIAGTAGSNRHLTPDTWTDVTGAWVSPNAVNWGDTIGNLLYIGNVQLEYGDVATEFEHRTYAQELALCQRYYWRSKAIGAGAGYNYSTGPASVLAGPILSFPVTMREVPTMTIVTAPTYSNCTTNVTPFTANKDGAEHRVDITATGRYRAYNGLYSADAEL